jgi:hypothetical protein
MGRREEWPWYERTGKRYSTLRSACDFLQRSFGDVASARDGIWPSHKYEAACGRRFQGPPAAVMSGGRREWEVDGVFSVVEVISPGTTEGGKSVLARSLYT